MSAPPSPAASLATAPRRRLFRRVLRLGLLAATVLYFAFALLVLVLRYAVLPNIDAYRPDLERLLGQALDQPVAIRAVEAYWVGLRPAVTLYGIDIRDREGRSALALDQVEAELSWESLAFLQLRLERIEVAAPDLVLRRTADGRLFVAGLEIDTTPGEDSGFADWLLAQHHVLVRDAAVRWIDEQRGAPPLELRRVNFRLDSGFGRHRVGLTAEPPAAMATRIDLRGDFRGRDLDRLEAWRGDAYLDLDYADLAVWRQWVDYPVDLPQGRGGVRLWLGVGDNTLTSATADVRLADVRLRLRPDLPELALSRLEGRIAAERLEGGFRFRATQLALSSLDGIEITPADITLSWQAARGKRPAEGRFAADGLDLAALAGLGIHLPLDETLRQRLDRHRPGGKVSDFALSWKGTPPDIAEWQVKGRFTGLHLSALGPVPGLAGIDGRIEGDHRGGKLELHGRNAVADLPAVFPEPRIALDRFEGTVGWRPVAEGLEVSLQKIAFENSDVAGEASGRWHPTPARPGGPGFIDLTAKLTRAEGSAVWRYLPSAVGADARLWLRRALVAGSGREAALRLSGDLYDFPFVNNRGGLFQVKGRFQNARLLYADGWPAIEGIDGELLFEGARMLITAQQARILGTTVRNTRAEIADLLAPEELLTVSGNAAGPTAEFLRFIDQSPVGERIDRFTEGMEAEGRGELDIKLALPLRRLDQSRVEGSYRFDGNRLKIDPDLPPLTDVRGQLRFTADMLESKGLRANLLDGATQIDIRTAGDGNVQVNARGEVKAAALRAQSGSPLLDHLSGGARWSGTVRVKKKNAEVALTSDLVGLASSLPAPFNKTAAESLPLRFERKPPESDRPGRPAAAPKVGAGGTARQAPPAAAAGPARDLILLNLGKALSVRLLRRHDTTPAAVVAGTVALGDTAAAPPALPERGLRVAVALPAFDADFWRRTLAGNGSNDTNGGSNDAAGTLAALPLQFDLRTQELQLFDKRFRDIRVSGQRQDGVARFELKSPDLAGNFTWDSAGKGRVVGKVGQFAIPESISHPERLQAEVGDLVESLPALDLTIGQLGFKGRELGGVHVAAENVDGFWNARFRLDGGETQLKGTLKWRPDPAKSETRLEFALDTRSIEKLLGRLGYGEAIRRGSATLGGQLAWRGAPVAIDYPSLTGKLTADAAAGQFTKLEPGVGRLLGVLSLQSLPRRLTLDFRDIFSEGFAFDRIRGSFDVRQGVMQTGDLQITGPAAKVFMNGSIDLGQETQQLKVRVQPAVGETIAVGAMLAANPVAGAVAWAAQKLLKDPLDQVFAFEYAVSGSWQDPKVEKTGQTTPAPANDGAVTPPAKAEEKP